MTHSRLLLLALIGLILLAETSPAQDSDAADDAAAPLAEAASEQDDTEADDSPAPADPNAPKMMSGMSILGNEEAPKSLVIIPWKSSEIGDDLGLADGLDDSARPVDKEVFLRELAFYKIRSGE